MAWSTGFAPARLGMRLDKSTEFIVRNPIRLRTNGKDNLPCSNALAHCLAVAKDDDERTDATALAVDHEAGEDEPNTGHTAERCGWRHELAGLKTRGVEVELARGEERCGGLEVGGIKTMRELGEEELARDVEVKDLLQQGAELWTGRGMRSKSTSDEVVLNGEDGESSNVEGGNVVPVHGPELICERRAVMSGEVYRFDVS